MNRGDFLAGIASLPLLAAVDTPGAAGIDGEWLGTLSYGTDSETFALAFKKGKAGKLVAYMWNPAIGVYDLPASHVAVRNDTVTLVEAKLPLHYDGVRLTGKLSPNWRPNCARSRDRAPSRNAGRTSARRWNASIADLAATHRAGMDRAGGFRRCDLRR